MLLQETNFKIVEQIYLLRKKLRTKGIVSSKSRFLLFVSQVHSSPTLFKKNIWNIQKHNKSSFSSLSAIKYDSPKIYPLKSHPQLPGVHNSIAVLTSRKHCRRMPPLDIFFSASNSAKLSAEAKMRTSAIDTSRWRKVTATSTGMPWVGSMTSNSL